ncbi:MAG: energy transducer TonB [Bacteroidetes bacterium]|nr:energy transducer TonB [Bacteroidota bacterium]MBK9670688.1 energy transducer TonB [Bacteroidota bacterium]MBK9799861.1 energy transducer TonB [Bacteroidota bacterium]
MRFSKLFLVLSICLFGKQMYAQKSNKPISIQDTVPFVKPEVLPMFPGGDSKLMEFVSANIKYPAKAKKKGNVGTSYISFIIKKTGEVSNIKTYKGIPGCASCDDEAKRVVALMPKWTPGKQDGEAIDVQYILPVKFSLK